MVKCPKCGHEFIKIYTYQKTGHRRGYKQTPEHVRKRVIAAKRTREMKKFVRENK